MKSSINYHLLISFQFREDSSCARGSCDPTPPPGWPGPARPGQSWTLVPGLELCKPLCTPCSVLGLRVYLDLNRNQTAMPPSSSSVTTPARDNEDLLVLSREPADTKHIASQSPALECSRLRHRRAGHQQGGLGWGLG